MLRWLMDATTDDLTSRFTLINYAASLILLWLATDRSWDGHAHLEKQSLSSSKEGFQPSEDHSMFSSSQKRKSKRVGDQEDTPEEPPKVGK